MNEFSWWLLIVGLVVGGGLAWLVLADSSRREDEISEQELRSEAIWIAAMLADSGRPIEPGLAEEILRLHREYLASPPPDAPIPADGRQPTDEAATTDAAPDEDGDASATGRTTMSSGSPT
jgi:hypothetical protein